MSLKIKPVLFPVLLCLAISFAAVQVTAQSPGELNNEQLNTGKKTCNFYVFTQDASKKFDLLGTTALIRICIKSMFMKKKLYVIVARNSRQVCGRIISILNRQNAVIGNIWFDSHGLYKQGYSSFHIGSDEFSYKNIHNSATTAALKELAPYCNGQTNVGIGSCYGGATFNFPGTAKVPPGRMNGDSLMMGLGEIFSSASIFGSESWVMAKPGIFNNNFGFAGYPLGKRYRTTYWQPVWERLGQWNRYSRSSGIFEAVNTVALNRQGIINVRARNYQELFKGQKAVWKNLTRLEKTSTHDN